MPYHPWTAAEVARAAEHRAAGVRLPTRGGWAPHSAFVWTADV